MHGLIVELRVRAGDYVSEGDVVAVIEAMKMMNEIRAHKKGVVATIAVTPGATIEAGSALMTLAAP
jgi:pyruvate carboxylase subunit B